MQNYLIRISFCVFFFCCLCVFLYFNHYITLYYSFQFNIIIHTHGSPGWLLLISVFFFVYFLSFLKRELVLFVGFLSFAYFPYRCFFPLFLLNMYLWISRSLLFTLLLYQLLLMLASIRICSAACPSPPLLERKSKKTCDRPPYLSSLLSLSLHTIITIRRVASSLAVGVLQLVGQPVKTLVQTVAAGCAGRLNVPVAVPQRVQAQLVGDFGGVHRIW